MSATRPIGVDGEDAVKRQLDALANGECDHVVFLEAMKERFRFEPDENWEVLSLLDQYYRRGKIPLDIYRAIKNGFAEYILGPQVAMPTLHKVAAPAATPAASAPAKVAPAAAVPASAAAPPGARASVAAPATRAAPPTPAPSAPLAPAPMQKVAAPPAAPAAPPASAAQPSSAAAAPTLTPATTYTGTLAPTFTGTPVPNVESPTQAAIAASRASTAPVREVRIEDVLRDRYRVEAVLARGSSATLFEVNDAFRLNLPPSGKRLALKVARTPDPRGNFLSQLRHEFHQLQHLSHPNIVRAFDFDRDGALSFFTMELLNGVHLPQILQTKGGQPLPRAYALAIIRDLGSALVYAHARGVVHGDVNPQNVFITMGGEVRLLGFGAAHKLSAAVPTPEFERASASSDTHRYASCEVFEGNRPTVQDDIYSLSCLTYLLLKGRHPYADTTSIEARATRLRPRRPAGLTYPQWRTLRAGLSTNANKRPGSMQDWLDALALGGAARRLPAANELIEVPADKPRRWQWLAAAAAIAALIGVGYWFSMNGDTPILPPLAGEPATEDLAAPPEAATPAATPAAPAAQTSAAPTAPPTLSPPPTAVKRPPAAAPQPQPLPKPAASQRLAANAPSASASTAAATSTSAAGAGASSMTRAPSPATGSGAAASALPPAAGTTAAARISGVSRVEMAVDTLDALPTDTAIHVTVHRKGNLRGPTSFTWWTESGTAKPGVDFSPVLPHVEQMQDGESTTVLTVPLISTVRAQSKGFYVGIESTDGGAQIGARALTQITLPPTN